jgi:holo-[acyl-carrier protein] synthase
MVSGIGIDLVYIPRVKKLLEKWGEEFKGRLFTPIEVNYCEKKRLSHYEFAAKIAAKEAFTKALGLGFRGGIKWQDIEVVNEKSGKPIINLYGKAKQICKGKNINKIVVSLSHDQYYATAVVILEI